MSFRDDFAWQRKFLPEIKHLCVDQFITEAPPEEDRHHNTDLMVLWATPVRIACRVRTHQYVHRFGHEITIRTSRPHGKTELAKIFNGWGDYLFYGFASEGEHPPLFGWTLIDLKKFRCWHRQSLYQNFASRGSGNLPGILQKNGDGSSEFRAFDVRKFSPGVVIARKDLLVPASVATEKPTLDVPSIRREIQKPRLSNGQQMDMFRL